MPPSRVSATREPSSPSTREMSRCQQPGEREDQRRGRSDDGEHQVVKVQVVIDLVDDRRHRADRRAHGQRDERDAEEREQTPTQQGPSARRMGLGRGHPSTLERLCSAY